MPDFASILDQPAEEIKYQDPIPVGTYLAQIKQRPQFDLKSSQKQTPFTSVRLDLLQAADDVDEAALEEAGGLEGKHIEYRLYETEGFAPRIRKFLEDCGFTFDPEEKKSKNYRPRLRAALEDIVGCEVYVQVRHESSQDGKRMRPVVGDTAAVD